MKIKQSLQKLGLCFLVFLLSACAVAESKKQTISQLSLLFVGDIMQHDPQIQAAYDPKTQTYSYDDSLKYVKPIFETTDVEQCWDGSFNGKDLNNAVFIYTLEATLINGEQISLKGNVSLIR